MSNLIANGHQLYASATPGSTVGSRIIVGQEVAPLKKVGTVAGDYAIIFDDVTASSAAANFSAIGCDAAGTLYLKSKLATYQFSDAGMVWPSPTSITSPGAITITSTGSSITLSSATTMLLTTAGVNSIVAGTALSLTAGSNATITAQTGINLVMPGATYAFAPSPIPMLSVNGAKWLGGNAGPFGTGSGFIISNIVGLAAVTVQKVDFMRIGNKCLVSIAVDIVEPVGAAPGSFDLEFTQMDSMRPVDFAAALDAIGCVQLTNTLNAVAAFNVSAVPATKRVTFTSPPMGIPATRSFGQYTFTTSD